jgi:hypothetical protein
MSTGISLIPPLEIGGSIATGQVAFGTAAGVIGGDSGLFWDNVNKRLGVGTNAPTQAFDVRGKIVAQDTFPSIFVNHSGTVLGGIRADGVNKLELKTLTTAPVSIQVNNSEKLRVLDTGNVLINTITDAGFRLDVNGTARFFNTNTDAQIRFTPSNATSTILLNSQSISGGVQTAVSGTYAGLGLLTNSAGHTTNIGTTSANGAGINFWGSLNGSAHSFKFFHNTNEIARLSYTGNLLLNTTTDAGFKLDVNGTARVQSTLSIGNSAGDNTLTLNPQSSGNAIVINNGGYINFGTTVYARGTSSAFSILDSSFTSRMNITWGGGTSSFNIQGNFVFGAATANASAMLQVDSTTRGFLPPRMTTVQRDAIASPVAGLIVYDTTLNLLHFFNGTIWVSL